MSTNICRVIVHPTIEGALKTLLYLRALTFYHLAVNLRTTRFNIQKFYRVLTLLLILLCGLVSLYNTNKQVLCNPSRECLQRGTHWDLI